MKWSSKILLMLLVLAVSSLLASNIVLKQKFERIDKNDTYWTYDKILEQPFRYLKIDGGNLTNIAFEQSPNCSVRISQQWLRMKPNPVVTWVKDDTLHIQFNYSPSELWEKNWLKWLTVVRIFAPELASVEGSNTNLLMSKLRQKSININMQGKSNFEIESFIPDLDSISVSEKDSSEVVIEMSPEYKPAKYPATSGKTLVIQPGEKQTSRESFTLQTLRADLQGYSVLDVGHGKIGNVGLRVADSSAIVLSGEGLKKYCQASTP